jgi:hypothetical protein
MNSPFVYKLGYRTLRALAAKSSILFGPLLKNEVETPSLSTSSNLYAVPNIFRKLDLKHQVFNSNPDMFSIFPMFDSSLK